MPILVRKFHHLVFNRRAIARTHALDLARIKRGFMKVLSDRIVHPGRRVADVAIYLRLFDLVGRKRECDWPLVCLLTLEGIPADRSAVEPRRRSCFESADRKTEPL